MCNDYFGYDDANLACRELNYTAGAICYATSIFPPSRGIYIYVIVSLVLTVVVIETFLILIFMFTCRSNMVR